MVSTFVFPNKIFFGAGALQELPTQFGMSGVKRPLLVTDPGLVDCGMAERVKQTLDRGGISAPIFSGVEANPTEENVLDGVEAYDSEGCDGVIGLGGGSPLDVAKGIRVKATHELPLAEYAIGNNGWEKMTNPMPPMAAVPTTAGTGSDVARGALIIVRPSGAKVAIVGENLFPAFTISDPELTLDLPPHLTAGTGMDALTHCIEEYISPRVNPLVDGLVLEGISRCARSLVSAFEDGRQIEARGDMMIAAMTGGIGFNKGLGVVHSLSHPIGSIIGGHHGTTNAILLPASLEFNFDESLIRFRAMAAAAELEIHQLSDEECGRAFIDWVRDLNRKLNIPNDLSVFGATREHITELVPMCMADHCHQTNPRACTESDFENLLEAHIP